MDSPVKGTERKAKQKRKNAQQLSKTGKIKKKAQHRE